jgi:rRNA processing protein Gar1
LCGITASGIFGDKIIVAGFQIRDVVRKFQRINRTLSIIGKVFDKIGQIRRFFVVIKISKYRTKVT